MKARRGGARCLDLGLQGVGGEGENLRLMKILQVAGKSSS